MAHLGTVVRKGDKIYQFMHIKQLRDIHAETMAICFVEDTCECWEFDPDYLHDAKWELDAYYKITEQHCRWVKFVASTGFHNIQGGYVNPLHRYETEVPV